MPPPKVNPLDKFVTVAAVSPRNVQAPPRIPDYIRKFHSAPEWQSGWDSYYKSFDDWRKNIAQQMSEGLSQTSGVLLQSTTNAFTWDNVKGKPSFYPPIQHTHTMEQVNGLVDALAGKADTDHTHEIADVTGLQEALDEIESGGVLTTDKRLRYGGTASVTGLDLQGSSGTDIAVIPIDSTKFILDKVLILNATGDVSSASITINDGTLLGGLSVATVVTVDLTDAFGVKSMNINAGVVTSSGVLYVYLDSSSSNPGTVDIVIFYHDLDDIENDI